MTVKNIIKTASTLIGREDVVKYLDGESNENDNKVVEFIDIAVRLLNLVINELACSFIPVTAQEKVNVSNGKIKYEQLKNSPLEILKIYDANGVDCMGKVTPTFVFASGDSVYVEYSYFPKPLSIEDALPYAEKDVSERVLAYGLIAEYSLTQGCFNDAVTWHKRYEDGVALLCNPKNASIKARSWL